MRRPLAGRASSRDARQADGRPKRSAHPSAASAYQFLGCILQFGGEPTAALEAHQAAQRLNPTLQSAALALSDMALCHLLLGDEATALDHAAKAVRADPRNLRALQRHVAALGFAGQEAEAARGLDTLLGTQPGFGLAYVDATYPFSRPEDRQRFLGALASAGWEPARDA